jgi:hypothetical protein
VIADPPSLSGAVQLTVALALPLVTTTAVGASATASGTTEFDADELDEEPTELVATTLNVYDSPFVRPATVQYVVNRLDDVQVAPPGVEVAVYPEIVAPPLLAGAFHFTSADRFPA